MPTALIVGASRGVTAETSVEGMLAVLNRATLEDTGRFYQDPLVGDAA